MYVKELAEMAIKVNLTSPTQNLVKSLDKNLELSASSSNANQRFMRHSQTKDSLTLTESASALAKLFQSSATAYEIDATRVREIKSTIEYGNHKIDSARVAQKLIHFEYQLA